MSFLDRIAACNHWDPSGFIPWYCGSQAIGWMRPTFARTLAEWPGVFQVSDSEVRLNPGLNTFENRSAAIAEVLQVLDEKGIVDHIMGEQYPIIGEDRHNALFVMDRAAAPYFGIKAYGQHVNGIVETDEGLKMWIGRRALDRRHFPGKLDNMAAGGLPFGISLVDNLAKECDEEAGIPESLAMQARPVGAITYCRETEKGLKPDILYSYDLYLPAEFVPHCKDAEMSDFYLWPLEEVISRVRDSDEFKPNCSLVVIDFLIRHGHIHPHEKGYLKLLDGLHAPLP